MTREVTAAYRIANDARHFDEVIFAKAEFDGGTVHFCSREHNVEWDGESWLGFGKVGMVSELEEVSTLEPRGVEISMATSPELIAIALDPAEYKNRKLSIWRGLLKSEHYLSLPGASGNYASTPDSAANSILGDIDIRIEAAMDDWTPGSTMTLLAKVLNTGAQRSYALRITGAGNLQFGYSTAGASLVNRTCSVIVPAANGGRIWVRTTADVDDGAGNHVVKFWTSTDYDPYTEEGTWTQLGSTVTTAGTISLFNSTAAVEIGSQDGGTGNFWAGKVHYAEVRNGIDGPIAYLFDPSRMSAGQTSAQMKTGEVWTVNQSGATPARLAADPIGLVADPAGPAVYFMDSLEFEIGEVGRLRLSAEPRTADWHRPRVVRYNDADQQALYPGDDFFANVEEMVEATLIW